MSQEQISDQGQEVIDEGGVDYIKVIEELKANTVSKEKYAKLEEDNKNLLSALINGSQIEMPDAVKEVDVQGLRKELCNADCQLNNLEYIKGALELRKALIDRGEPDPFLPIGRQISPTEEDRMIAKKVADIYQECIIYADGDSELFTQELMRRTNDVKMRPSNQNSLKNQLRR